MSETPTTPAPELLSAERLAEIQELALEWHAYYTKKAYTSWPARLATTNRRELLAHAAALTARTDAAEAHAAEAEAQVAMLRVELAEREGRADCHCSARSDNECTCR